MAVVISSAGSRLKLRELVMPELVDPKQLRETAARPKHLTNGSEVHRLWHIPAELYPNQLSGETAQLAQDVSHFLFCGRL